MKVNHNKPNILYRVTYEDIKPYMTNTNESFWQKLQKVEEGAKRSELTKEELDALRKKHQGSSFSSEEEKLSLFSDLVEAGILTRERARDIYCGFVPLSPDFPAEGRLEACQGSYGAVSTIRQVNGFGYFQSVYDQLQECTDMSEDTRAYRDDYRTYLDILKQIRN